MCESEPKKRKKLQKVQYVKCYYSHSEMNAQMKHKRLEILFLYIHVPKYAFVTQHKEIINSYVFARPKQNRLLWVMKNVKHWYETHKYRPLWWNEQMLTWLICS